jgi:hypothetical protein
VILVDMIILVASLISIMITLFVKNASSLYKELSTNCLVIIHKPSPKQAQPQQPQQQQYQNTNNSSITTSASSQTS